MVPDTGGGFGQKVMVQRDEMCLMLAAPLVGAPLKWVETRVEHMLATTHGRDHVQEIDLLTAAAPAAHPALRPKLELEAARRATAF